MVQPQRGRVRLASATNPDHVELGQERIEQVQGDFDRAVVSPARVRQFTIAAESPVCAIEWLYQLYIADSEQTE